MQHFFVRPDQVSQECITIEGLDVNHIRSVLRMKVGEQIKVSDGHNGSYLCKISQINADCVLAQVLEVQACNTELASKIYLFQGIPKGDKMELVVQKAVELGVHQIIPVLTNRCVVKLDDRKSLKKVERWNSIALSGAKQSGRAIIPEVTSVMSYKQALSYADQMGIAVRLIPYELAEGMGETKAAIGQLKEGQSIGVFIGPEGGFDKQEVEACVRIGAKPITLGKRILRTETAGLAILSILMYHIEQ